MFVCCTIAERARDVITVSKIFALPVTNAGLVVESRREPIHQSCNPRSFLATPNSYGRSRFDTSYLYRICHPRVLVSSSSSSSSKERERERERSLIIPRLPVTKVRPVSDRISKTSLVPREEDEEGRSSPILIADLLNKRRRRHLVNRHQLLPLDLRRLL